MVSQTSGPWPCYLGLSLTELRLRAQEAVAELAVCRACPRDCGVDRLRDEWSACRTGRHAVVASWFAHGGEEDCLRGRRGSGTIFFAHCNLRCVFCQNLDISQGLRAAPGAGSPPEELAGMMLALQARGCHNVNLVTPEHVVPQIVEALPLAVAGGLGIPLVYNTGGYDAVESLELLDGLVDIYMPDFKAWSGRRSRAHLKAGDYPMVARDAIREMHRQVGPLQIGPDGLARRGVLVRHLIMPGCLGETAAILDWLAAELGPDTYVNLMDRYRPAGRVGDGRYPEIDRRPAPWELAEARRLAAAAGLWRLDGSDAAGRDGLVV